MRGDDRVQVHRAEEVRGGRVVLVEQLANRVPAGSEASERFLREAMALTRLEHPNLVRVIDFGSSEGRPYLVRDVPREQPAVDTLAQRLAAKGRLPLDEALSILLQVAEALEQLHQAETVHGDLTPANVLLGEGERG